MPETIENKNTEKWHVEPSDRIGLMYMANNFISTMVCKMNPGMMSGEASFRTNELDGSESKTYESALEFMKKQFDLGPSKIACHLVETSTEDSHKTGETETASKKEDKDKKDAKSDREGVE